MGWGIIGVFYDKHNKKIVAEVNLDYLKSCMKHAYSSEFIDANSTYINLDDDFYKEKYVKFQGYYKKEVLDSLKVEKMEIEDCNDMCYVVLEGFNEETMNKNTVRYDEKDKVCLYTVKERERTGTTYTLSDIKDVLKHKQEMFENEKAEYDRMEMQSKSLEFYNLSTDARNEFISEKNYLKESVDDYKTCVYCVQSLVNIFECFCEDYYYNEVDKFGVRKYSSKYSDNRDIILFLEVV